jgi:hypothetical protein
VVEEAWVLWAPERGVGREHDPVLLASGSRELFCTCQWTLPGRLALRPRGDPDSLSLSLSAARGIGRVTNALCEGRLTFLGTA